MVLNKVLPDAGSSTAAPTASATAPLRSGPRSWRPTCPPTWATPDQVARVLHEVGESFLNFQVVAKREAEMRAELAASPDVVATVPYFDHDITDLAGLLHLGEQIWR